MRRTRAAVFFMTTLLTTIVQAMGLGSLETTSSLNQPFEARIPIVGATPADLDTVAARLADAAQFERAGVGRDAVLLALRFELVTGQPGQEYLRVSTADAVREPFLNFLVELAWANGRIVREYTVLLDPPTYVLPPPVVVNPAPVPVPVPVRAAEPAPAVQAEPAPAPAAAPRPVVQAPAEQASAVAGNAAGAAAGDVIDITPATTAWGLAMQNRPAPDISVYQMLTALVRANPEAFAHTNVHFLRQTARIRVPDEAEARALSAGDARAEFDRQTAQRDVLLRPAVAPSETAKPEPAAPAETAPAAAAAALETPAPAATPQPAPTAPELTPPELTAPPPAAPALSTAPDGETDDALFDELDESTPDALEAALEAETPAQEGPRLKLEVPELPPEGSATTEGTGGAADGALALEQADVVARENEDLRAKAKEADEIIALFKQQIADKDKELAALQARVTALEAAARSAAQTTPESAGASAPMALDDVSASLASTPLLAALALLALLGGWWVYRRRQVVSSPLSLPPEPMPRVEMEAPPPLWTQAPPAGMSVEEITGSDNSTLETVRFAVPQGAGEPDSLEEVNIFLAYERFEEAEDLVRAAIRARPDHHAYKLRLLEVLYAANRRRSFEEAARDLYVAVGVDSPLWQDSLAMWQEMSPDRALFAPISGPEAAALDDVRPTTEFVDISAPAALPESATGDATRPQANAPALDLDLAATPEPGSPRPVVVDIATGLGIDREHTGVRDPRAPVAPEVLDQSVEFDLADTIWPGDTPNTAPQGEPESRGEDYHLEFDIAGLGDTTDLAQSVALELDPLARSVDLDLSLRDTGGALRAPAASNLEPASSEDDLEFDLSLQDTTDLETLNMREVLKDLEQTVVAPEQAAGESLAEITRSMEASIASLDVDAEPGPDLTLEPLDADGDDRDFEFTLDGGPGSMVDTLSLDPGLLEKPAEERNREDIVLDLDLDDADEPSPLYETDTKLSLAKAYLELGDAEGARQILDEVLQTGNAVQQEEARRLLPPQG